MSDFGGFNFSDLPRFDLGLANTARQAAEISAAMDDIADYNRKKDEALFETAEASRAQKELLERQLEELIIADFHLDIRIQIRKFRKLWHSWNMRWKK